MAGNSTISITFKVNGEDKTFQVLSKDADGLRKVMQSTIVESDKLKASLINWSASVQAIQATSQAVAGLNNAFQSMIAQGESFGKAMREVNTLAGKSGKEFDDMKDKVADLSKTIPLAREELAQGLYQVISNQGTMDVVLSGFGSRHSPSVPPVLFIQDGCIFPTTQKSGHLILFVQVIQILQEEYPGRLLHIIQFAAASFIGTQSVIYILEDLLKCHCVFRCGIIV